MNIYPWDEILANVDKQIKAGHTVYQQYLCEHCGQKLTMEEPNHFHESGTCDKCGKLTDIKKNGMNFMVAMKVRAP